MRKVVSVCLSPHLVSLRHEKVYTSTRQSKLQVSFYQSQVCTVTCSTCKSTQDIRVFINYQNQKKQQILKEHIKARDKFSYHLGHGHTLWDGCLLRSFRLPPSWSRAQWMPGRVPRYTRSQAALVASFLPWPLWTCINTEKLFLKINLKCARQDKLCLKYNMKWNIRKLCAMTHAFICGMGAHSNHRRPKEGGLEGQSDLPMLCPVLPEARLEQMGAFDESFVSWR